MQNSSAEFENAMNAPVIQWASPLLRAGWLGGDPDNPHPQSKLKWVDAFDRTLSGVGWGSSPDGVSWTSANNGDLDVVPGKATIRTSTDNTTREVKFNILDSNSAGFLQDVEIFTIVSATETVIGATLYDGYQWKVGLSNAAGDDTLVLELGVDNQQKVYWSMYRFMPSDHEDLFSTDLSYGLNITYTANKKLGVKIATQARVVAVKIWDYDTQPEPEEWTEIGNQIFAPIIWNSYVGVWTYPGNGNGAISFDYHTFRVTDLRTLGNLSPQIADSFTVLHEIDDGLPDAVSSSAGGNPVGSMAVGLTGSTVEGVPMDPRQYFSPFNVDSPISGYDRDTAPVELDFGAQTVNGEEFIRLFTGKMANIPLSGRSAALQAVSAMRLRLAKAVKCPVMHGIKMGGNASALISFILYKCGVVIAPLPYPGTRYYAPMHGSSFSYIPELNGGVSYDSRKFAAGTFTRERPPFRQGKFLGATDTSFSSTGVGHDIFHSGMQMGPGADALSLSGAEGRVEFWILGSEYTNASDPLFDFRLIDDSTSAYMLLRVNHNREIEFLVEGPSFGSERYIYPGLSIPLDNQWHFVGMHYDLFGNKLTAMLDGKEITITPSPALNTANLSPEDNLDQAIFTQFFGPSMVLKHPISELMFTTGNEWADPTNNPFNNHQNRVAGTSITTEDWEDTTYNIGWRGTWARSNTRAQAGTWSFKSAAIGHNLITDVAINLPANTREMSFFHWVSSEGGFDYFNILLSRAFDQFASRTVANGWGTAPDGHIWTITGGVVADFSVGSDVGKHSLSTLGVERVSSMDELFLYDTQVSCTVHIPAAATGSGAVSATILARRTLDFKNYILGQILVSTTGAITLRIRERFNEVDYGLATIITGLTHSAGNTYGLTLKVKGTTVSARVWNTTGNEPNTWNATATTNVLQSGSVAISSIADAGITNVLPFVMNYGNVSIRDADSVFTKHGIIEEWQPVTLFIPLDVKQVTFRYHKDASAIAGSDAVWIDSMGFNTAATITDTFVPEATVRFVDLELESRTDSQAKEAWAYLAEIAQSCMTGMRTDEIDRLNILPPGYFVEVAQQVEAETISTELNAQDPEITLDPTKIRNSIQVNFKEALIDTSLQYVFKLTAALLIPAGTTVVKTFNFDLPAVYLHEDIELEDPDNPGIDDRPYSRIHYNTAEDGSGTYMTNFLTQASTRFIKWDGGSAEVEFVNKTGAALWVVNDVSNRPFFGIGGLGVRENPASTTVSESQVRGERTLGFSPPLMQRRDNARRLSASILGLTRASRAEVKVNVLGDPRRQPGDIVRLADIQGSEIDGTWRVTSIDHQKKGAAYTQALSLRKAFLMGEWDNEDAGWDEAVWG